MGGIVAIQLSSCQSETSVQPKSKLKSLLIGDAFG